MGRIGPWSVGMMKGTVLASGPPALRTSSILLARPTVGVGLQPPGHTHSRRTSLRPRRPSTHTSRTFPRPNLVLHPHSTWRAVRSCAPCAPCVVSCASSQQHTWRHRALHDVRQRDRHRGRLRCRSIHHQAAAERKEGTVATLVVFIY